MPSASLSSSVSLLDAPVPVACWNSSSVITSERAGKTIGGIGLLKSESATSIVIESSVPSESDAEISEVKRRTYSALSDRDLDLLVPLQQRPTSDGMLANRPRSCAEFATAASASVPR